jgi:hypothetical protein
MARDALARAYQARQQPLPGWTDRPAGDGGAS